MHGPNRNLPLRLVVPCAVLLLAPLANAVNLNPRGLGQVLIYPYYTVNGGQNTLLSLVNTTAHAKALKLHFREVTTVVKSQGSISISHRTTCGPAWCSR